MQPPNTRKPWIQSANGRVIELVDDTDWGAVGVSALLHALSQINRYTGHTRWQFRPWWNFWTPDYYTVAQHSVLVSYEVGTSVAQQREALLHDLHEAVVNDLATPVKSLCPQYKVLDKRVRSSLRAYFLGSSELTPTIASADLRMLQTERIYLLDLTPRAWDIDAEPYPSLRVKPWSSRKARRRIRSRYMELFELLPDATIFEVAMVMARRLKSRVIG